MADKVLGPEWGNLAGLPAEKALEYVAQYAADLESKANKPAPRGGENDSDDDDDGKRKVPNSLDIARSLNQQSKAPLGAEFVGRRENARRQARSQVEALGYKWNDVEGTVEDAMAGATPEQQTNPQAWVAAFVYAFGQADIMQRASNVQNGRSVEDDDGSPPRSEYVDDEVVVRDMGADRGNRFPVNQNRNKNKIEDPTERRTKQQFEKVLGYRIPDDEWIALSDPDMIKTQEDWDEYQASRKQGGR